MGMFDDKKTPNSKYGPPELFEQSHDEVEYQRFILNLDEKLIQGIERYIYEQKQQGTTIRDLKTGRYKKINRSLWAREVLAKALREVGIDIDE